MKKIIAIVGGGPVGTAILCQLDKIVGDENKGHLEIIIYEKSGVLGPGLPYSTTNKHHIINLPASVLSPFPEQPNHFIEWLATNETSGANWKKKFPDFDRVENAFPANLLFPPRELYGIYLKDSARTALTKAREQGVEVEVVAQEVLDIQDSTQNNKPYKLVISDGTEQLVDYVLLAIGHMESDKFTSLEGKKNYIHNPWKKAFSTIERDKSVGILGSRLTAIDVALDLMSQNHQGKITFFSRGGLVPTVIGETQPYRLEYLTRDCIETISHEGTRAVPLGEFIALFEREMARALKQAFHLDRFIEQLSSNPAAFLDHELQSVESGERVWQSLLYALYGQMPFIWNALGDAGKRRFKEKYESPLMTYLAAFPAENAKRVLSFLQQGQLEIKPHIKAVHFKVEAETPGYAVELHDGTFLKCDYVINGTGPGYTAEHSGSTLLTRLVEKGILQRHPFGGVKVNFTTLEAEGRKGIYVLGELARGTEWATTDLGTVGKHAARALFTLKKRITSDMAQRHSHHTLNQNTLFRQQRAFSQDHEAVPVPPDFHSILDTERATRFFLYSYDGYSFFTMPVRKLSSEPSWSEQTPAPTAHQ